MATLQGRIKTAPPVKGDKDRAFLRDSVVNGTLDYIATDHAGCDYETGKTASDFRDVYNGIPGVQTLVPVMVDEFAETAGWPRLATLLSINPAKRLGLYPRKGALAVGSDADLTILETGISHTFDERELLSLGKFSPFHNREFHTRIAMTVVRGQVVFTHSEGVITIGTGTWVRRPN
jgi:dihydroorotase-like cyclic amidohydrolase